MGAARNIVSIKEARQSAAHRKPTVEDLQNSINAINRVQAVIEFNLDGTIYTANDNFLKAMGYELSEIQGKHHRMFCDPAYTNTPAYQSFWDRLNRGEFDAGEYKRFHKSGREIWIQASYNPIMDTRGKVTKIIKFATDVTAQKMKNIESDGKLNALSKAQAVIEFNLDGSIITANDNFLKALGYDLNEIQGRHHRMFCDPAYVNSPAYQAFWQKLNSGSFDAGEYMRLGKGGREIWIQASYNPILDLNGKPFKVVKFANDITQLKMLIRSLEDTAVELAQASQQLTGTATQMSETAQRTSVESGTASRSAGEVATGVQTVAVNTEEMSASIKEIARSANESAEMAKNMLIRAKQANQTISQLGLSSQEIGNVIKVISSIAQQTNLLALNATIEAARAGDAGKGFAVVANEVKELAKQTAKATEDITQRIGAIQKDTSHAVESIGDISQAIDKLNGISGAIAAAVEEQTATTNEVARVVQQSSRSVENIASTIKLVSAAAEESSRCSGQTLDASRGLQQLADKLSNLVKKVKN